ncbi:Peptidyl-prolyl isomerase cwc27, partial [Linderina macrospora]
DKRKAISDEGEPETNPKKPKKHTNALSALLSQYKTSGSKKSKKDTKSREDELFARLGSFQSKIRSSKSKTAASQPATAGTAGKCTLHGVLDCQSCWRSQLDTDVDHLNEAGGSENWLAHSLAFKRNKERVETEYAPKVEDYVVIDPRDREASIKRRK